MYKRITSYIYKYVDGEKRESRGYVKQDIKDEETKINLNIRDSFSKNEKFKVFVAVKDKDAVLKKEIGRCISDKETVAFKCIVSEKDIAGIVLINEENDECEYVGSVNDEYIDLDFSKKIEKEQKVEEENADIRKYDDVRAEKTEKWQDIVFSKFPKVLVDFDNTLCEGIKMRPHDLVWFPKEYWGFSSNQYLLSGYYGSRYILFVKGVKEREGKYYLCVPGTIYEMYKAKEQGFGEYVSVDKDKGYWCHEIKRE